jgi:hypothetical protein
MPFSNAFRENVNSLLEKGELAHTKKPVCWTEAEA